MNREVMNIVIAGHVDHGKSTIIGRLLNDTQSLPEGKLEQVQAMCRRNSKPFEYAFLLDALKDERSQGITIDSARVFFKTKKRDYIIIDAPGHIEFLKNMITGSSRAEAALLVIDAEEGIQENSYRHGYMLSMLGIKQIVILVNKMDKIGYRQDVFDQIEEKYSEFLTRLGLTPLAYVPVSGREGDMIVERKNNLDWYKGMTVQGVLDNFDKEPDLTDKPFRLPVQDVYKFTQFNDDRRIVAGTIVSGKVSVGDEIIFYPSGKASRVKMLEVFNRKSPRSVSAPDAVGLTLQEQIYIRRGEMAVLKKEQAPHITTRIKVSLFWLGKTPMTRDKTYGIKIGTAKVPMVLESIEKVIDASSLSREERPDGVRRHDVAECVLRLKRPVAFDCVDVMARTSRFVIVEDYAICGGGIVREPLSDDQETLRDMLLDRNYHWVKGRINLDQRMDQYQQKPRLVLITGEQKEPRKEIARSLEESLFQDGRFVYFLGIGSVIHGIDADITNEPFTHKEHLRRLGELSNILLDSGMILIISAIELTQADKEIIQTSINMDHTLTVWVGSRTTTDITHDLKIKSGQPLDKNISLIKELLNQ